MLIAMILAGVIAGPDAAQTPPVPAEGAHQEVRVFTLGGDGPGPRGPALDKNGDGFVTRDEFTAPQTQAFDFLDKNRDGKISTEEFADGRAAAMVVLGGPGAGGGLGRGPVRVHVGDGGPHGALFSGQMGSPGGESRVFVMRRDGADGDLPPPPPGAPIQIDRIGGPGGEGPGDLDKDHDGKVSEEEFLAPLREAFQRMDADHSGYLESGEKSEGGVHVITRRVTNSPD
ncbi:EF-hand domain-containing protein [Brevundimonas goettingensis]|uniref:EF-hand domain-containing protein n=1 Tax=Brevundimonas goettingensis TaxID=2774190 RepID=A0A975C228_9CAUL|nr:hypothetical protein [Brevundimonas goettingensis]QTC91619.1 hypothetical protein IFJ75_01385 [Brevundimonas goettingensis]